MALPSVAQLTRALKLAQDLEKLQAELDSIMGGSAIDATAAKPSKRGRPPGSGAKKKRGMSEEGRQRIIEAQKKRWAAKKKVDGKN